MSAYADVLGGLCHRFSGRRAALHAVLCAPHQNASNLSYVLGLIEPTFDAMFGELSPDELARSCVEVFNEPTGREGTKTEAGDMVTRDQYVFGIQAVCAAAKRRNYPGLIIAGGLANLSKDSLDWYAECAPQIPPEVVIGYHGYPKGAQNTYKPWVGGSWHANLQALRDRIGGRDIADTEDGQHMATEPVGWLDAWREGKLRPYTTQQSEEDIYRWAVERLRFNASEGVILTVLYQHQDGVGTEAGALFGLHQSDGVTPKRQAAAVRDWRT